MMLYHFHVQTGFLPYLRRGKIWRPRGSCSRRQIKIVRMAGIQVIFLDAQGKRCTMPAVVFMHHYRPASAISAPHAPR
jgi:hypothetical protein